MTLRTVTASLLSSLTRRRKSHTAITCASRRRNNFAACRLNWYGIRANWNRIFSLLSWRCVLSPVWLPTPCLAQTPPQKKDLTVNRCRGTRYTIHKNKLPSQLPGDATFSRDWFLCCVWRSTADRTAPKPAVFRPRTAGSKSVQQRPNSKDPFFVFMKAEPERMHTICETSNNIV